MLTPGASSCYAPEVSLFPVFGAPDSCGVITGITVFRCGQPASVLLRLGCIGEHIFDTYACPGCRARISHWACNSCRVFGGEIHMMSVIDLLWELG